MARVPFAHAGGVVAGERRTSPPMVQRVSVNAPEQECFYPFEIEAVPAGRREGGGSWKCCARHEVPAESCTMDRSREASVLHEFWYTYGPQEGPERELSVQKLQVSQPAVIPTCGNTTTYKEQLCLKLPPQKLRAGRPHPSPSTRPSAPRATKRPWAGATSQ